MTPSESHLATPAMKPSSLQKTVTLSETLTNYLNLKAFEVTLVTKLGLGDSPTARSNLWMPRSTAMTFKIGLASKFPLLPAPLTLLKLRLGTLTTNDVHCKNILIATELFREITPVDGLSSNWIYCLTCPSTTFPNILSTMVI